MKSKIFILLLFISQFANAQQGDTLQELSFNRFAFKFYPASFLVSQLTPYCSDIQFGFEYFPHKRHSVYFIAAASIPHLILTPAVLMFQGDGDAFFGGRGAVGYRYYLKKDPRKPPGFYIGAEVSVAYYNSLIAGDRFDQTSQITWHGSTAPYHARAIMSNYNVTVGFHREIEKYKHRRDRTIFLSFDIGFSVGYRYHYFWRHYEEGNLEYVPKPGGLYSYYKTSPIGGSFNLSIGRFF